MSEQALDQAERVGPEAGIAPRSRTPTAGAAFGFARPLHTIVAAVAAQLARGAVGCRPKARVIWEATPLRSQRSELIPLSRGDLMIRHADDSLHAGKGSSPVPQTGSLGS